MKLEIRDNTKQEKEPVAQLWLGNGSNGYITLYYQTEGGDVTSLACFNEEDKRFHVFDSYVNQLDYRVTSTKHPE